MQRVITMGKKIYLVSFILLFLCSTEIFSQLAVKVKRKEFKEQDEGFKEAWKSIKEGNRLFMQGVGLYRNAREKYLDANEYNSNNAELNYMIGKSYLYTDDKFKAIDFISKAFDIKPDVNYDIHLMMGMAFHQVHEFEKAIVEYERFLGDLDNKQKEYYLKHVGNLINQCENGIELVKEPKRVVINNLGRSINSVYDEYAPFLTGNEESIYFTSRRNLSLEGDRSILDSKYFEDIYYSNKRNGEWTRAKRLDGKFNTKKNNTNIGIIGMSGDKSSIYVYKGKENNGDVFVSSIKKGEYRKAKPVKKANSKYKELSLCFSHDSSTMYFVSDHPKSSYGGSDIYFIEKKINGKWGKPRNMGSVVNTFRDEISVSLSDNDSVLFFSSKGHNSMGGYDVFRTELAENGGWSEPVNIGYPINTPNNDIFYQEIEAGRTAYYATNREAGYGGMDIFKVIYLGTEKEMMLLDLNEPIRGVLKPYDDIYFHESKNIEVDSSFLVYGLITDSESGKPIVSKIEIIDNQANRVVATTVSDTGGSYLLRLPQSKIYGVEIVAKGYLLFIDLTDISNANRDIAVRKDFQLVSIEVGAKVILKNIYFESGKSTLMSESFASLNNVVKLLESNPTLRIEISGHTDNVGSLKSNMKLSNDRAKAVVDYLVAQGIVASRLEYKGYAFQQPVAGNDTEEGRAQNRRVEFKILSK